MKNSTFVILGGILIIIVKCLFPNFKTGDDSILLGLIILFIGHIIKQLEGISKGG